MTTGFVHYRENPTYKENSETIQPRFFGEFDLCDFGVDAKVTSLPVYHHRVPQAGSPDRYFYSTRFAGLEIEAPSLLSLERLIHEQLKPLIRFERLPEYVFQVGDNAWPIYQLHDQLLTRYPGGPVFNANDISNLRIGLADHFKQIGRIEHRREMDLLYFSNQDLQLYAPFCVLRVPGEIAPDIPIFPMPGEREMRLIAPISRRSISVPYNQARGIFTLQAAVGGYWAEQGHLKSPLESTIRKLPLDAWKKIAASLVPYERSLTYERQRAGVQQRQTLPIYMDGGIFLAARENRMSRVVVYTAANPQVLAKRVGQDLYYYGSLENPQAIEEIPAD
jgi:hypothetical protein